MIPIPYLREILGGACLLLLIACVALGVMLKTANARLDAKSEMVTALEQQVSNATSTIEVLRSEIDAQNAKIRAAELAGVEAQAYQVKADQYAAQLDNAKALLLKIQRENIDLRERAKNLGTCETYELVLRSIAGVQ